MGEELEYFQQWGAFLYSILLLVSVVLLAIGILLPIILLAVSRKKKLKKVSLSTFAPNGALLCGDPNVRSTFGAIYKRDGNLVIVAQPTTKKASITLVTSNEKLKATDLELSFKNGDTVEVPVRNGVANIAIIVNSCNGKKVNSENSVNPSNGLIFFAAFFPSLMGLLACASQIVDMFFMLSDQTLADGNFMMLYILAGANLVLFLISYLVMKGIKK